MQGKYLKPDGETVQVAEFDEANKMVCVKTETRNIWYSESEYSLWIPEETPGKAEVQPEVLPSAEEPVAPQEDVIEPEEEPEEEVDVPGEEEVIVIEEEVEVVKPKLTKKTTKQPVKKAKPKKKGK